MSTQDGATAEGTVRGRLYRIALLHLVPTVVFGLVAWSGAAVTIDRAGIPDGDATTGFGVPYVLGGTAGAVGSAAIVIAALLLRRRPAVAGVRASACRAAVHVESAARVFMVIGAVAVVAVGYPLAPTGMDRGFVFVVNGILAVALALFALFTGDLRRTVRIPPPSAHW